MFQTKNIIFIISFKRHIELTKTPSFCGKFCPFRGKVDGQKWGKWAILKVDGPADKYFYFKFYLDKVNIFFAIQYKILDYINFVDKISFLTRKYIFLFFNILPREIEEMKNSEDSSKLLPKMKTKTEVGKIIHTIDIYTG